MKKSKAEQLKEILKKGNIDDKLKESLKQKIDALENEKEVLK